MLLSLLGLLSSSIFVLFETQKGQDFLLNQGLSYLEKKGIYLKLEGFEGDFPKNFKIQKIVFFETPDTPFLIIEKLNINFKWQNIFKGILTFKNISAKKVNFLGLHSDTPSSSFSIKDVASFLKIGDIPVLPFFSLALKNFEIRDLVLPRTSEKNIHLYLRGFLKLPHFSNLTEDSALIKIDGINIPSNALLRIEFDPHSKKLNGTLEIEDSPGGLLNIGESYSLNVHFTNHLNSSHTEGDLTFFSSSISNLRSNFVLTLTDILKISLKGDAEIPTLLKEWPNTLSPAFDFEGDLLLKETDISSDFTITHQDFKLSAHGNFPLNQDPLTFDGTAEILNLDWLKSFEHPAFLDSFYQGLPISLYFNIKGDLEKQLLISLTSHEDNAPFSFKAINSLDIQTKTSHGDLEIKFPFDQGMITGTTHFTWQDTKLYLNNLILNGPSLNLHGNLYWVQDLMPFGEITFDANHLNSFDSILPDGHLTGTLSAQENQKIRVDIVGEDIQWQDFTVNQIQFKGETHNYMGKDLVLCLIATNLTGLNSPSISLRIDANGDLDITNPLKGTVNFTTLNDPQFSLDVIFETYLKDHTAFFMIHPLKTKIYNEPLSLTSPLKFIISENAFIFPEATLQLGDSSFDISFEKKDTRLKGHVRLQNFSLGILRVLNPSFALPLIMSGEANLKGTIYDPSLILKASLLPETQKTMFEEPLPHFQSSLDGKWNGKTLSVVFNLKNKTENLALNATLPIILEDGKHLTFPESAPLKISAKGSGDLETLSPFLISEGDLLKGEISLSLLLEGSLKERHLSGFIKITKGSYQSFKFGTVLENITFNAAGKEKRFQILEASAQDASKGNLQISGFFSQTITENGPESYNLQIHLNDFRSVSLDLVTANATGDLQVQKNLKTLEPSLTGNLTLTPVSVHIPKKFPSNIPVLPVKRIGSQKDIKAEALKDQTLFLHTLKEEVRQKLSIIELTAPPTDKTLAAPSLIPSIPLQIRINIPSKFSVEGWGLSSFWQGNIDVSGSLDTPILNGNLFLVSGNYNLFGKTFTLLKGSLSFTGTSEIDPLVNVVAQITTADIVAQILIDGRLTTPEFTLQSQPMLPSGEIVSRILFGKGIGSLSPFQSLQIASALGDLTGTSGPLGFVDEIRNSLGLGALSFTSGASSGGPGLNLGRFLSNDVSLNVTPDLTTNSAQASVEVKVFPHVTIQSDLDTQSAAGGSVNWQWDYD